MIGVNTSRTAAWGRLLLGCVLGLCLMLGGAPLSAAPKAPLAKAKPETADQKVARAQLERGQGELNQGHAEAAMSSFLAARQLDDSLAVETAVADAQVALGKPVEARAGYSEYIDRNRASLTPEQLGISQAKLDEINGSMAQLKLEVSEVDAEVTLDGALVGRSPLPSAVPANPGPHTISLKKPGFVSLTQQFVFARGGNALSMALVPEVLMGKLRVTSPTQSVAELLVNNQVVGLLPWEGSLPVGKVTLIARTNDQTSAALDVIVERDITKPVSLELLANEGVLDVSSAAVGVRIAIDGRAVGTQNWHGSLPVGSHRLQLARDGFLTQEQDVQVQAGSTDSIVVGHWVAAPRPPPKPKDDHGLYFRLDLAGAFGPGSDGISQHCDAHDKVAPARCASKSPVGTSLGLRVGYRFNWIAPEIFGLGSFAVSYVRTQFDTVTAKSASHPFYGPERREDYIFFRYGWAAGAGVRVTTPSSGIAATGGIGVGVFSESGQYARSTSRSTTVSVPGAGSISKPDASSTSSNTEHSYAPGLLFDGGLLLGSSTGTKLYLGVMAAIEFAPEHSRTAATSPSKFGTGPQGQMNFYDYGTPGLDIVSGTQFRIGPVLGFQFGY
jgi:PEGA domain